jgi:uncharacterized protein YdaU (DUF1376 family)
MARPGKAPAFQFYPRDYLCDLNVRAMSYEQRGVYWELVSLCWLECGIPSDLNAIAKILGMKHSRLVKLWPGIAPCFVADGERLQHPRLNAERLEQEQFAASKSSAGKAGNDKRWGSQSDRKPSHSDTSAIANDRSASASASSPASAFIGGARPRAVMSGGAGGGMNPRDHLNCRGNGARCSRICVSEKQHGVLRGRMGGNDPDGSLDAFYAEVRANLDPAQPIGDTPWKFWDAQFAARFGTVAAVNPRTAGNAAAAARFVARGQA